LINYDPTEDLRFPVRKMHLATELLLSKGDEEFTDYCRRHHMPQQDRQRCVHKAKLIISRSAEEAKRLN